MPGVSMQPIIMGFGSCIVLLTAFTGFCIAETPELEILPAPSVQTKAIGRSIILTCRPKVKDPGLVSDLVWRDTNNRTIEVKQPQGPRPPMYTELNPQDMTLSLYIPMIAENHAGNYTCMATYARTEHLQAGIRLQTIVAITWVDAPLEQFPIVGKQYKVRCEVQASPAPTLDWFKNGVQIETNDRYVVETKGLLIRNVKESDDGIYTCRAVVRYTGEAEERNIKVEVHTPPKLIETEQNIYEFVEGESATVTCQASGKPRPTYNWIKASTNENLAKTERFGVNEHTGVLTINRVEQVDHSDYKCIAKNPAGLVEQVIKINVLVKPNIYELFNVSIPENNDGRITCRATGRPAPKITFRKFSNKEAFTPGLQPIDNRIILDPAQNENRGETVATLIINPLRRSDDGLYECIAENKGGKMLKNGHITVEFKPSFEASKNQLPVWTWDNKPANLSCIAESIPNATIEWRFQDRIIENGPNYKIIGTGPQSNLIVKPAGNSLYGLYKCTATNKHGKTEHFIELKEARVPSNVVQARIEVATATTIRFSISPPANDGMPLTAFTVEYKKEQTHDWRDANNRTWSIDSPYILEGLQPQTTYNFRFAAHNAVGRGPWGANQLQTMPSRSYPEEPKILTKILPDGIVTSPYADHFELRWKIPADNGEPIDHYQLKYCPVRKVNDKWTENIDFCENEEIQAFETTAYELNRLIADSYYKLELRAHNAIGYSMPSELIIKTARGKDTPVIRHEGPMLSSVTIIGIVIAAVLIILLIVDLSCFCVNRSGIIMCICEKARGKPVEDDEESKLGRDEKEPLRSEGDKLGIIDDSMKRNTSVEFDGRRVYSKTGEIIGKNSAV